MKIKWTSVVIALALWGGNLLFSPSVYSQPSNPLSNLLTVPQAALDLSDLDARDQFNRPIKTARVIERFQELWTTSLNRMLMLGLTPLHRRLIQILSLDWTHWCQRFAQKVAHVFQDVKRWYQERRKRIFIAATKAPSLSQSYSRQAAFATAVPVFDGLVFSILSSTFVRR